MSVDILLAPDPVVLARRHLAAFLPNVLGGVPVGWEGGGPLIVVRDGGGAGERSRVLRDARITIEAYAPTRPAASLLARRALGVMRAWPDAAAGVYWRGELAAPAYLADPDSGEHRYVFTVEMSFRAARDAVPAL